MTWRPPRIKAAYSAEKRKDFFLWTNTTTYNTVNRCYGCKSHESWFKVMTSQLESASNVTKCAALGWQLLLEFSSNPTMLWCPYVRTASLENTAVANEVEHIWWSSTWPSPKHFPVLSTVSKRRWPDSTNWVLSRTDTRLGMLPKTKAVLANKPSLLNWVQNTETALSNISKKKNDAIMR